MIIHVYEQVEFSTDLGDTRIKGNLTGESTDLGIGFDLVLGMRAKNWRFEAIASTFTPGAAFENQDASQLYEFSINYKF